jgi:hypothetical protein
MRSFNALRASTISAGVGRGGRLGAALIAVLALAALVTATASAASQKLDLTWEVEAHQLAPAQTFDMALGSSVANERTDGPLTLATNPGTVTCDPTEFPWSGLGGVDETNDEKTDKLEMSEDYFDGACSNTTGLGTKALVGLIPDDSILNLSSKGKAELKAQSGAAPIYLIVIYSGGDECLYTTTKLKGSLSLVRSGAGISSVSSTPTRKLSWLRKTPRLNVERRWRLALRSSSLLVAKGRVSPAASSYLAIWCPEQITQGGAFGE